MRFLRIPLVLAASLLAADPCCRYGFLFPETPCADQKLIWIADVSLLAWQAREEGLDFALKNNPLPLSASVNVNGDLVGIDFNWEPAFKINLGAYFADRAWDAQFRWTYFHTRSSRTSRAADPAGLIPLWAFPSADIATEFLYGTARGALELNFNAFDVEMGYSPFLSPALSIRFIAGLKIANIDQNFTVNYSDGFNQLSTAQAALTNNSIGAGPKIGFDSKWRLGSGFSLLASIAGSLPLWHYRATRTDTGLGFDAGAPATVDSFFKERFWTFRSILETSLGLGWNTCFGCRSQYPFGVGATYEFQYFSEQNMMPMLVNPGILNQVFHSRGDLHFQGATLTFHFGF